MSLIFFIPANIHPAGPFIHKNRNWVCEMYECSEHVGNLMYGETDTLMTALYKLCLILNEPVGPAIALSKPDIQVLNIYDMPFPAKGASHY